MARDASQSQLTDAGLPLGLARELRRQNPWWTDDEPPAQPHFRRWPFQILLKRLTRRQQVARINVLRGPRQIGKTTLQYQLILQLLAQGVAPRRILRVQFDELKSFRALGEAEPILAILDWFADNILGQSINRSARAGEPVMIFLDEVQNIASWHVQLKAFVDRKSVV